MGSQNYMDLLRQRLAQQQAAAAMSLAPHAGMNGGGQYRTQFTPYLSDGNVPLSQALGNSANKFSFDALMAADPDLKQPLATVISQYGHDPFGVYAAVSQPQYQLGLLQRAMEKAGLDPLDVSKIVGRDARGNDTYPDIDSVMAAMSDEWGTRTERHYDDSLGLFKKIKKGPQPVEVPYQRVLRGMVDTYNKQMDDFITQAAPSMGRNINNIDFAWQRLGGMPYPGMGADTLDYGGTGPAFPAAPGPRQWGSGTGSTGAKWRVKQKPRERERSISSV